VRFDPERAVLLAPPLFAFEVVLLILHPSVDAVRAEFFKHVWPAEKNRFADFEVRQFSLPHPKIDRALRASESNCKFPFCVQPIACAVEGLLVVITSFHWQQLRKRARLLLHGKE
jgi:hypothetical protein